MKKLIRRTKQKTRKYSDLSVRWNDLKVLKNVTVKTLEGLKQTVLEMEYLNRTKKLKLKEIGENDMNLPRRNRLIRQNILECKKKKFRLISVFFRISRRKKLYTIKNQQTLS